MSYSGVYGVVVQNDHILLTTKQKGPYKGLLDLPGGGIEEGESCEMTLRREFLEEIAHEIEDASYLVSMSNTTESFFQHEGDLYLVNRMKPVTGIKCEEEWGWYPISEISWDDLTPFARYAVCFHQVQISKTPFIGFSPVVETTGACCMHQDRFLLVKRHPLVSQGCTWGLPGGKQEKGETIEECVMREISEETGIILDREVLEYADAHYVRYPVFDYVFHTYRYRFDSLPNITLNTNEHTEYRWVTYEEALKLPLIPAGKAIIQDLTFR